MFSVHKLIGTIPQKHRLTPKKALSSKVESIALAGRKQWYRETIAMLLWNNTIAKDLVTMETSPKAVMLQQIIAPVFLPF